MRRLWELRARLYDLLEGSDLRRGYEKHRLFRRMTGPTLFLAVGTGLDILHLPPKCNVIALDLSEQMLLKAAGRAHEHPGTVRLMRADAQVLPFPEQTFDTVVTSCTMCSVPSPDRVFAELVRVLRPGGTLLMFEHVRSGSPLLGAVLDAMNLFTRWTGTEMNRRTMNAARRHGFLIESIDSVYLDIILSVRARKPLA